MDIPSVGSSSFGRLFGEGSISWEEIVFGMFSSEREDTFDLLRNGYLFSVGHPFCFSIIKNKYL